MRDMRARKLVTLSEHRRRGEQETPPARRVTPDPSEAETAQVPVQTDRRFEMLETALEAFRVPKLRPRTLGVEPLRSDFEERHRA